MQAPSTAIQLAISHHQIHLWSGPFDENNNRWMKKNLRQGAILNPRHATFDPIVDFPFTATVRTTLAPSFKASPEALRSIQFPIDIDGDIFLSSVEAQHKIKLAIQPGKYTGYFEICEPADVDEVYFQFTLVATRQHAPAQFLMDDNFGASQGKALVLGNA